MESPVAGAAARCEWSREPLGMWICDPWSVVVSHHSASAPFFSLARAFDWRERFGG